MACGVYFHRGLSAESEAARMLWFFVVDPVPSWLEMGPAAAFSLRSYLMDLISSTRRLVCHFPAKARLHSTRRNQHATGSREISTNGVRDDFNAYHVDSRRWILAIWLFGFGRSCGVLSFVFEVGRLAHDRKPFEVGERR